MLKKTKNVKKNKKFNQLVNITSLARFSFISFFVGFSKFDKIGSTLFFVRNGFQKLFNEFFNSKSFNLLVVFSLLLNFFEYFGLISPVFLNKVLYIGGGSIFGMKLLLFVSIIFDVVARE